MRFLQQVATVGESNVWISKNAAGEDKLNKKLMVSAIIGAVLGVICIIGGSVRIGGFAGNAIMAIGNNSLAYGSDTEADMKASDPQSHMEAKHWAAREKEQVEIARCKAEIVKLDAQAARSYNTLDVMLTIVHKREKLQKQLEKLKSKQQREEAKRLTEIKRLKKEIKKKDIRTYQEIILSPFGKDMKDVALKSIAVKYPEVAAELEPGNKQKPKSKPKLESEVVQSKNIIQFFDMEFVLIKPGTFMMGSSADEPGRDNDETQHSVTLTKKFYIQTTEVTQGQWRKAMKSNPSYFKDSGEDCPIESVSFDDCQKFIRKLNKQENTKKYRLPTEAEWEYACRAGSKTAFTNGDITKKEFVHNANLDQIGWYSANSERMTHPVGKKKPNKWGLYDMHGNVWEWCQDRYGRYPYQYLIDPKGSASGTRRVFKGGSWLNDAAQCRSANRFRDIQSFKSRYLGFRLVMTAP